MRDIPKSSRESLTGLLSMLSNTTNKILARTTTPWQAKCSLPDNYITMPLARCSSRAGQLLTGHSEGCQSHKTRRARSPCTGHWTRRRTRPNHPERPSWLHSLLNTSPQAFAFGRDLSWLMTVAGHVSEGRFEGRNERHSTTRNGDPPVSWHHADHWKGRCYSYQ